MTRRQKNEREWSKKSVQQGRSHFGARSVHAVREHGKRARTPLAAFFNIPLMKGPASLTFLLFGTSLALLLSLSDLEEGYAASDPPPPPIETDPDLQTRELDKETKAVALRGDDERLRPESQFQTKIGRTLVTFTGALSLDFNGQDNLNLESAKKRDRFRFSPELALNFIFSFPRGFYLFSEFSLDDTLTFRQQDKPMNTFAAQIDELFLQTPLPLSFPAAIRIGRQQFFEPRRWFISDTLDAIRLLIDPGPFHVRFSASTPVPSNSNHFRFFDDLTPPRQQVDWIASATYDIQPPEQKSQAGIYLLVRDDDSARDEDAIWVGLRSFGRPKFKFKWSNNAFLKQLLKPRIRYWLEAAFVAGSVRGRPIRGYAFDIGASYIARKLPFQPFLTLGYALGSGDSDPTTGTDHNFRQTGFHSNSGKFGGVVNFDYYGILLDPELSNLHILTAGVGIRPIPRTSIDVVYHHYEQHALADQLRSIDVRGDLTGKEKNIGDEIDVIVGIRVIQNIRVRLRSGYFIPGPAFSQETQDPAFEGRLDVLFSF